LDRRVPDGTRLFGWGGRAALTVGSVDFVGDLAQALNRFRLDPVNVPCLRVGFSLRPERTGSAVEQRLLLRHRLPGVFVRLLAFVLARSRTIMGVR